MTDVHDFSYYWQRLVADNLSGDDREGAFEAMMTGKADPILVGAFLVTLRERGETEEMLVSAARVLRRHALRVKAPAGSLDSCGTGGDGQGTVNISTAVALVVSACGVPVAKHGNRAQSSKCGSADVIEALGIRLTADTAVLEKSLKSHNFAFLFAPYHHAAMKHVASVRQALKVRTLFNLVGPLANPCAVDYHLLGVADKKWLRPMAQSLARLKVKGAWVVHSRDGNDELSLNAPNDVLVWDGANLTSETINAAEVGLSPCPPQELQGGDAHHNAKRIHEVLQGKKDGLRDTVVLNSAAALVISGKAPNVQQGVAMAQACLDDGRAAKHLAAVVARFAGTA
ncbi:MAG: anthranilate phosphoribosyltransferase [Alphaproteobacteria bacterium GM202ARS2]|nr:anthranilate phosphoribosyltransferase [Alphaproteobacteria bacterium GM202ARS2]